MPHRADQQAGDHTVLIGEVLSIDARRDHAPLVFYRSSYHTIETQEGNHQ
jgi:flavin reductase (DIM6/NTAB) family NADH-FMN oxidoreductase RutF